MTSCQKLYTPFLPPSFHSTHLLFGSQFPSEVKCLPNLPSFHPSIHSVSIPFKREGLPEHAKLALMFEVDESEFLFPSNGKDFQNSDENVETASMISFYSLQTGRTSRTRRVTQASRESFRFYSLQTGRTSRTNVSTRFVQFGKMCFYSLQTGRTSRTQR